MRCTDVTRPPRLALFALACFWIVGRVDELFARRKILSASPAELPLDPDVVLEPDTAQELDCRDLTQEGRGISSVDSHQQGRAIATDEWSRLPDAPAGFVGDGSPQSEVHSGQPTRHRCGPKATQAPPQQGC